MFAQVKSSVKCVRVKESTLAITVNATKITMEAGVSTWMSALSTRTVDHMASVLTLMARLCHENSVIVILVGLERDAIKVSLYYYSSQKFAINIRFQSHL